jgi:heptose I phosphotransferase
MNHESILTRLVRGTRWVWLSDAHRGSLPPDLAETVMDLDSTDRHHAKQGRSTARVRFDAGSHVLSVYLKRHQRLPWPARLAALVFPQGRHTPGAAEWAHLERAKRLGIPVPEVVAAGESIGPWGRLSSFLMVAELTGCLALNEAMPTLIERLTAPELARLKRSLIAEMAQITATLHRHHLFHKDLYLCHFFLNMSLPPARRLTLIDLHRLGEHRWTAVRWRWKDLAQLLFSTHGVPGIDDRDRLRFWKHYRRLLGLRHPRAERSVIRLKAARYLAHSRA